MVVSGLLLAAETSYFASSPGDSRSDPLHMAKSYMQFLLLGFLESHERI